MFHKNFIGHMPTNWDMEVLDLSFPLEPTWPGSIPNDQEKEIEEMKYDIETGIPIPTCKNIGIINELREMMQAIEIGQSFFVPLQGRTPSQISGAACQVKKKMVGKNFTVRKTFLPPFGMRIWRIE